MAENKGGAPAWIVTFADLMALLLTFFVLLLSFSTVDKEKYKAMVESMARAFGAPPAVIGDHPGGLVELPHPRPQGENGEDAGATRAAVRDGMERALAKELAAKQVVIEERADDLLVRFPEEVAFPSGAAELTPPIRAMLDKIAPSLRRHRGPIVVVGHTDDRPIYGRRFRSNWDLSAARAVSVVHYLIRRVGLPPERLTAQGQADTRPLFPNDSPAHRAANRRVELILQDPLKK